MSLEQAHNNSVAGPRKLADCIFSKLNDEQSQLECKQEDCHIFNVNKNEEHDANRYLQVSGNSEDKRGRELAQHANVLTFYNVPETNLSTVDEHEQVSGYSDININLHDAKYMGTSSAKSAVNSNNGLLDENGDQLNIIEQTRVHLSDETVLQSKAISKLIEPVLDNTDSEQHKFFFELATEQTLRKIPEAHDKIIKDVESSNDIRSVFSNSINDGCWPKEVYTTCDFCGKYGTRSNFKGRFCSKICIGKNAAKRKTNRSATADMVKLKRKLSPEIYHSDESLTAITETGDLKIKIKLPTAPKSIPGRPYSARVKHSFIWDEYLSSNDAKVVPIENFEVIAGKWPFPLNKNPFRTGWFVEAVDPNNQSFICLTSVAQVLGPRLRLHIEGYHECYDFWVNADSPFIFPCGFCESTGRQLAPPKGYQPDSFDWKAYTGVNNKASAYIRAFSFESYENLTKFQIGDKLEAVDRKHFELICVATVSDVISEYLLIHFDGWGKEYDYWVRHTSPFIRYTGTCKTKGEVLSPPLNYDSSVTFVWQDYLAQCNSRAAPNECFVSSLLNNFEPDTKLEVVDERNPILLRVATIVHVDELRIKVHFDGWSENYDWFFDIDSLDIHPIKWCLKAGHPLQPPPNYDLPGMSDTRKPCPVDCCNGLGHANGPKVLCYHKRHYTEYGCPYANQNVNRDWLNDRLLGQKDIGSYQNRNLAKEIVTNLETSEELTNSQKGSKIHENTFDPNTQNSVYHCSTPLVSSKRVKNASPYHTLSSKVYTRGPTNNRMLSRVKCRHHHHCQKSQDYKRRLTQLERFAKSSFVVSLTATPSIYLPTYWDQNVKLLPGVSDTTVSEVTKWNSSQVASFIERLTGKYEYGRLFAGEDIDGEALLLLEQNDISDVLKMKLGPAVKIYNTILFLKLSEKEQNELNEWIPNSL